MFYISILKIVAKIKNDDIKYIIPTEVGELF